MYLRGSSCIVHKVCVHRARVFFIYTSQMLQLHLYTVLYTGMQQVSVCTPIDIRIVHATTTISTRETQVESVYVPAHNMSVIFVHRGSP